MQEVKRRFTFRRAKNERAVCRFLAVPVLAMTLLGALPAQSQLHVVNLGLYHEMRDNLRRGKPDAEAELFTLLDGILDGMKATQAAYVAAGKKPEFCVPQGFVLKPVHLMEALDKLLAGNRKYYEDTTAGLGFYAALAMDARFRCS